MIARLMARRLVLRDDRGLTVIEVVIASTLSLVILMGAFQLLDSGTRHERGQQARHSALLELRGAMTRMSKDVRQALSIEPSSTRTRLDMQGLVLGAQHQIVFELTGGKLVRKVDGASVGTPLASDVTSTAVFCYDPPDCVLATPSVEPTSIRISIAREPEVFSGGPITLATDVELRNI